MSLEDPKKEELTLEELREVLKKFEPNGESYEFRNTAIYYSFKYNYDLCLKDSHTYSCQQPKQ